MAGLNSLRLALCAAVLAGCSGPSAAQAGKPGAPAVRGPVLLVGNKGEDSLSFIDLASGRELARRDEPDGVYAVDWDHAGERVAVTTGRRSAKILSAASFQVLAVLGDNPVSWAIC